MDKPIQTQQVTDANLVELSVKPCMVQLGMDSLVFICPPVRGKGKNCGNPKEDDCTEG